MLRRFTLREDSEDGQEEEDRVQGKGDDSMDEWIPCEGREGGEGLRTRDHKNQDCKG